MEKYSEEIQPRRPYINIHCHLLNFDFVPSRIIQQLVLIPEWLAKMKWLALLCKFLGTNKFIPIKPLDRMGTLLNIYRVGIDRVTKNFVNDINDAGIDVFVPLMMDLFQTIHVSVDRNILYEKQIKLISEEAAKYPWRLFPFIMFDPRREDSFLLCRKALEDQGFIGIKMYPALGYYPCPEKEYPNNRISSRNLAMMFEYCSEKQIPITVHCNPGGPYTTKVLGKREDLAWKYTEVTNWDYPLGQYKGLKVNFAHFGGDFLNTKYPSKGKMALEWRGKIKEYMRQYNVYTDLSAHEEIIPDAKKQKEYFEDLRKLLSPKSDIRERILFGSDSSMISGSYSEKEYIEVFKDNLEKYMQDLIFKDNPRRFLFGENGIIPKNYVKFLKQKVAHDEYLIKNNLFVEEYRPSWIKKGKGNNDYLIV